MNPEKIIASLNTCFSGIPYNHANGPLLSNNNIRKNGINCQLFVHIVLEELFAISLPKSMRSLEIFCDQHNFEQINSQQVIIGSDILYSGDIFLFAISTSQHPSTFHLGIYIGHKDDEPVIAHFTPYTNGHDLNRHNSACHCWPLDQMLTNTRYQHLMGIRRFRNQTTLVGEGYYLNYPQDPLFLLGRLNHY